MTAELGLVAVDVIVFDVVTEEVGVGTPGSNDVADELWLCVVTDSEVVVVTPGTDNDVLMPRVVVLVALVVHGMEAGLFRLKIISSFNDIILFNVPAS